MPTAELLKPRRLRKYGRIWERGQIYPISVADAQILEDDDRFKIKAFGKAAGILPPVDMVKVPESVEAVDEFGKPKHHGTLMEAIREASDALDVDEEDNFEDNGLPKIEALIQALGFTVTDAERDEAMGVKAVERKNNEARAFVAAQERGDMTSLRPQNTLSSRRNVPVSKGGEKGLSASAKIKLKKKSGEPLDTGAARLAQNAEEDGGGEGGGEAPDPTTEDAKEV